jgi:hypothetical protein
MLVEAVVVGIIQDQKQGTGEPAVVVEVAAITMLVLVEQD